MSKHTPGPWNYEPSKANDTFHIIDSDADVVIAEVFDYRRNGIGEGRARLFAAAPELLAALNEIVNQIDQGGASGKVFSRDYCITQARAAIAKATTGEVNGI